MNITQRLINLDPTLEVHNEGQWSHTISDYSAFNDAGIECETGEFLYGLIRLLKPREALETGTHWGIGSAYIGLAMQDNGFGLLETHEFLPEIYNVAKDRIERIGLKDIVFPNLIDTMKYNPEGREYSFVLLDTEPQTRFAELVKYYPFVKPGGFIFIHDLHQHMHQLPNEEHGFGWPFGPIPPAMMALVREDKLRPFHVETPRGLTGFYKVHPNDFDWKPQNV